MASLSRQQEDKAVGGVGLTFSPFSLPVMPVHRQGASPPPQALLEHRLPHLARPAATPHAPHPPRPSALTPMREPGASVRSGAVSCVRPSGLGDQVRQVAPCGPPWEAGAASPQPAAAAGARPSLPLAVFLFASPSSLPL